MKKVYFISGLGADKRAFSLLDLGFCEPVFIEWIPPKKNETLPDYAHRLQVQIQEKEAIVVGLSFGGMLATEMARANPNFKTIILSSNKTSTELPAYYRIGKYFPIYKWLPAFFYKKSGWVAQTFFGLKVEKQKHIFRQIMKDSNPAFTKWAIRAILHWKNKEVPTNLVHIHGTHDKLLPCRNVHADYEIADAGHITPMLKSEEVSILLRKIIRFW